MQRFSRSLPGAKRSIHSRVHNIVYVYGNLQHVVPRVSCLCDDRRTPGRKRRCDHISCMYVYIYIYMYTLNYDIYIKHCMIRAVYIC